MVSVSPAASIDAMSLTRLAPPEPNACTRSMARLKLAADTVSVDGGENPSPGRIVNVYVNPSAETVGIDAAASG